MEGRLKTMGSGQFIQVRGDRLCLGGQADSPLRLTGFGLGGWMNMENFITGFAGTETAQRQLLRQAMGEGPYEAFFNRFMDCFFTDADACYLAGLGLNCLRVAVNYHHFEDDDRPLAFKESGFRRLDRLIQTCARHGIYTVIDLHAVPGGQNARWHSDNPTHRALFWEHREFQDRVVHLWEALAERYRDNTWVAGYNPLNEPGDSSGTRLGPFYRRLVTAIRAIDSHHVLFLDGNKHGTTFAMFGEPWENSVYSLHDYALAGFPDSGDYPGRSRGEYVDKAYLLDKFLQRSEYQRRTGTPLWVGEFGPVYKGDARWDAQRLQVLTDQLDIYADYGASWSLWTYKDIGLQGVRYLPPTSPYVDFIRPVLLKKAELGADAWGSTDEGVRSLLDPIKQRMAEDFPDFHPLPWGLDSYVNTLIRHIMFAEPLAEQFAGLFRGLSPAQAEQLAGSFAFEQTTERAGLADVLKAWSADGARLAAGAAPTVGAGRQG